MTKYQSISGNIVDLVHQEIYPGTLFWADQKIERIHKENHKYGRFIIPGLVDSHIHLESSMLTPAEFAPMAVTHGTVATVSDPHEIANVLGVAGIEFMLENSRSTPFHFYFGVPSCVPATSIEKAGATLNPAQTEQLLADGRFKFLAEMMDIPGVISREPLVMAKMAAAKRLGLPIDGHAPGLSGAALREYVGAGISTDHEASTLDEAYAKIELGMKIQIREGSAAQNFDALQSLIATHPQSCMLCSDDRHPDHLAMEHLDGLVRRALRLGHSPLHILQCACLNPIRHYGLEVGLLQPGDTADFVVVDNFLEFNILETYINGRLVAEHGRSLLQPVKANPIHCLSTRPKVPEDFMVQPKSGVLNVIGITKGQLFTEWVRMEPRIESGNVVSDPERDLLKMAVINRYHDQPPALGFIRNLGIKKGAVAASVAHDSHNLIVAGANDAAITTAVNQVIEAGGGICVVGDDFIELLPLPIAGLMSDGPGNEVARNYSRILDRVKKLGSPLSDPLMTLSFMSLPVIPELKLSSVGLVDVQKSRVIGLFS